MITTKSIKEIFYSSQSTPYIYTGRLILKSSSLVSQSVMVIKQMNSTNEIKFIRMIKLISTTLICKTCFHCHFFPKQYPKHVVVCVTLYSKPNI